MKLLFASLDTPGFLFPAIGLAKAMADRGHKVALLTSPSWRSLVRQMGVMPLKELWVEGEPSCFTTAQWGQVKVIERQVRCLESVLEGDAFDLLIGHELLIGPHLLARRSGIPLAVMGMATWPGPVPERAPELEGIDRQTIEWYRRDMMARYRQALERVAGGSTWPPLETATELAQRLYYDGHAEFLLQRALNELDRADEAVRYIPDLRFRQLIASLRDRCEELLGDICETVSENKQRVRAQSHVDVRLPEILPDWSPCSWSALKYLLNEWRRGFGEARHVMRFPRAKGFQVQRANQCGDVFQRALIADTFLDADAHLNGVLRDVIAYEVRYLLQSRRHDGIGGWAYFPELLELAPDADDLAQIVQVLRRTGHDAELEATCELPLRALLDQAYPEGSFETWIIPAQDRSELQERQAWFAKNCWGTGPDVDVIANLLYALNLWDPERFRDPIARGLSYLESQQQGDGSWVSTWYHGPYYGVFVCLRALFTNRPESAAIPRAIEFLQDTQNADGGWGSDDMSDALSTALALCALSFFDLVKVQALRDMAVRALRYLESTQEKDGGWPKSPFIKMDMGRASGKIIHTLTYGSRTITTNFVLKALLAVHQRLKGDSVSTGVNSKQVLRGGDPSDRTSSVHTT
jgi:hypothetical protein